MHLKHVIIPCLVAFFFCTHFAFSQTSTSGVNNSSINISGTVREAESGEALIGASVFVVRDTSNMAASQILRGARTNKFGFFSLPDVPVSEGERCFVVVRSIGFQTVFTPCAAPFARQLSIRAPRLASRTKEVTVRAPRDLRAAVESISRVEVSAETIRRLPSIGGQTDVFRALQLLPGIQSAGELSSGLYVRGGSPDQNLTLLDGALIYNPSHLAGFFSTFTADAVQDIRLYKGAFPAEYGGRISSVIDITMKEGNNKRLKFSGNLSTIIVEATLDGPIPFTDSNATFMLSARRMILDWFFLAGRELTDQVPSGVPLPLYYFYDLNAKLNYRLSPNDRLFLSLYTGRDNLNFDLNNSATSGLSFGLGWGNVSGNLRWAHVVSPNLFTNFSLIYTNYDYTSSVEARLGRLKTTLSTLSRIEDWTLRGEAEWLPSSQHAVKVGVEVIRHEFTNSVGTRIEPAPVGIENTPTGGKIMGLEGALYAQDEWTLDERLLLNIGARLSWFQAGGQVNLEPRFSAGYKVSDDLKLTGAFAIANQYVHLLTRNDISLPSDTWIPATRSILPARSMQGALGVEMPFDAGAFGEIKASVEGYYKTMENLYEYRDGTLLNTLNTERLEEQLTRGRGESYGVEVLLEKKSSERIGELSGWLGYTLSWANRTFPELNGGRTFAPRYDRRHNLSIALTYLLDEQWEFGATWTYITGQPITLPAGQANFPDINGANSTNTITSPSYYTGERNNARMTPFHKLDLSITARTVIFFFPGEYYLSIYNAYNNMNPFAWLISDATNPLTPQAGTKPSIQQITLFPILPTLGMRIKF